MPSWNLALWNPSNDDVPWALATLVGGATGYIYYRTFNGNKFVQLWGVVIPVGTIFQQDIAQVAALPAFPLMTVARWKPVWGLSTAGIPDGVAFIQLNPDGGLWLMGQIDQACVQANIDAIISIDL